MRSVLAFAVLACTRLLTAQEAPAVAPAAVPHVDFDKQIAPLLVEHCITCHGPKEQKGDFRLDARLHVFPVGSEDTWSITPGKPDDSDLVRRIGLPVGDEDIMPAKGEPLSKPQQELVRQWVAQGAEWPSSGDAAIQKELLAAVLPKITFELPAVDAAEQAAIDAAIAELRQRGAVVQPVAADTTAIDVNLSLLRDKVGDAEIDLLPPLAPVLVWLNLSRTAVTDASAAKLATLTQLRRLHAANTRLSDTTFTALAPLQQLEYLNAYGTGLTDEGLAKLVAMPKLQRLYAWQSKVTAAGVGAAREKFAKVQVDFGDYVAERMAAAEQEIAERQARSKPVNDICPVTGKAVDPAQSVDHDGKHIAFCCAKCKAAFQKEPAKYVDKLVLREEAAKPK